LYWNKFGHSTGPRGVPRPLECREFPHHRRV
jgi:hypothetical protein